MNLFGVGTQDLSAAASHIAQRLIPRTSAQAAATTSTPAAGNAAGGTITSNDFLQLLVTEMKNQDPTQPTDPNAYIQQLVGVNSLQQLIAINKDLSASGAIPVAVHQP